MPHCFPLFHLPPQTLTGKEIEIDIEPTDKVDRIKERVEEKEGIPPQQQRLIFSGKQMYVKTLSLCVCDLFIVSLQFSEIEWHFILPFLSFVRRNDDKTASDYKVQGGSVLHLVLALRGGV